MTPFISLMENVCLNYHTAKMLEAIFSLIVHCTQQFIQFVFVLITKCSGYGLCCKKIPRSNFLTDNI